MNGWYGNKEVRILFHSLKLSIMKTNKYILLDNRNGCAVIHNGKFLESFCMTSGEAGTPREYRWVVVVEGTEFSKFFSTKKEAKQFIKKQLKQ